MKPLPPTATFTRAELTEMLRMMSEASNAFYFRATRIGNHAFIEFTGLMNEYIKLCTKALHQGIDFTQANVHAGTALPMQAFERDYLSEKLECIYGTSLDALMAPAKKI